MNDKEGKLETSVGEMHKRRDAMADGRRYIIYYTFNESEKTRPQTENKEVK
jgi:hypothetical protein